MLKKKLTDELYSLISEGLPFKSSRESYWTWCSWVVVKFVNYRLQYGVELKWNLYFVPLDYLVNRICLIWLRLVWISYIYDLFLKLWWYISKSRAYARSDLRQQCESAFRCMGRLVTIEKFRFIMSSLCLPSDRDTDTALSALSMFGGTYSWSFFMIIF